MESIHCCCGKGEEQRLHCAQSGCQGCVNQLLREHGKLVVVVVRRQWLGERSAFADLVQEGNIALWRAILGFDPGRGTAFSSYAWRAIERAVWGAVARAERQEGWPYRAAGEELAVALAAVEEVHEQREALLRAVNQLPARQAAVVTALYGLEDGQAQTLAAVKGTGHAAGRKRKPRSDQQQAICAWNRDPLHCFHMV